MAAVDASVLALYEFFSPAVSHLASPGVGQ